MELRCDHKLHGVLNSDGLLEVKCGSTLCGSIPGVVVLHLFDPLTGDMVDTKRFKDTPKINQRGQVNGRRHISVAVRHP